MNILNEELLSVIEATKAFPGRPHVATINRWMTDGVRGQRLEFVYCGGRRFTSKEAIHRFVAAQNTALPQAVLTQSRRQDARADQELSRLGL